jgi:hypothetical protein
MLVHVNGRMDKVKYGEVRGKRFESGDGMAEREDGNRERVRERRRRRGSEKLFLN